MSTSLVQSLLECQSTGGDMLGLNVLRRGL